MLDAGPDLLTVRYEQLRAELSSIDRKLFRGDPVQKRPDPREERTGLVADDVEQLIEKMDMIDKELIELERHLPPDYSYPDQATK